MKFIRTNKTNLTDDELILFDALFRSWNTKKFLRQEEFQERLNFPYVHRFSDDELTQIFDDLLERRLIKKRQRQRTAKKPKEKLDWFTLTKKGGELWSLEREPNWENYCIEWTSFDESGSHVKVYSGSQRTLEKYVEFEQEVLQAELTISVEVQFKILENHFLIPWKRFSKVYIANWSLNFIKIREFQWEDSEYCQQKAESWFTVNDLLDKLR